MNRKEALELSLNTFDEWPYEEDGIMCYSAEIGRFDYINGNAYSHHGINDFWFVVADKQTWLEAKEAAKSTEKWTPQVGEECEAKENKPRLPTFSDWTYFILIAINVGGNGKLQYVMRDSDGDVAILYEEDDIEFRPYRTQEDIEREEGIEALRKLLSKGVGDCEPDKYLATVIWDEGYRKV